MQTKSKKKNIRPSWDEYFISITNEVAKRSTCLRRQVGAVLVKNKHIISTGYNGAVRGLKHCCVTGCLRKKLNVKEGTRHEICRGLHAEQNALLFAIREPIGSEIYTTNQPCVLCAKMLIQAGIKRIVYINDYPDKLAVKLLKEAKVKLERFKIIK